VARFFSKLLTAVLAQKYGFGLYSGRYGNIYTTRQLLQLIKEANGLWTPSNFVWKRDNRYFDALRPSIEPEGLASEKDVLIHRALHVRRIASMLIRCDVLIFTLGLTEAWLDSESGTVFPTAPGTICGEYDPSIFSFYNFSYSDVIEDLNEIRRLIRARRKRLRIILTVSPVPLTATASKDHVLTASTYSKSVLRAAAGRFSAEFDDVDYFPSYELIASHATCGQYYESNLRTICHEGVDAAMRMFIMEHFGRSYGPRSHGLDQQSPVEDFDENLNDDLVCEEVLLDAFS